MRAIGGSNHGQGFSGQPPGIKSIRVFKLDPDLKTRLEPSVFEEYFSDQDPHIGAFWRHESLDTPEKREAAIEDYRSTPAAPSVYDRASGGGGRK